MKVLLVNPPAYQNKDYIREGRCMQTKSSWAALWMPLSLSYMAALLRRAGHDVMLKDCIAEKLDHKAINSICSAYKPGLIFINTAFPSIKGDMESGRELKEASPGSKLAVFGLYPSLYEKKFMEEFPFADFAVMGEPEWVSEKLANALEKSGDLSQIDGLIWKKGDEVSVNRQQDLSKNDPDYLPFPARDLLDNNAYILPVNLSRFTLLSVGRGCPYSCIYCVANIYYGKKFRKRSVMSVVDEIEECINVHGIKSFLFWGESFTLDPRYGEEICDEIIKRGLKIEWSTASRVDSLNPRLLEKMKRSGCMMLSLGIETLNQEVLDAAKKGARVEKAKEAVDMVKKAGIRSMGHFIFGLPKDDKKSAMKSIDFACNSGVDYAQFYCAIPYPKTELGAMAVEKGWVKAKDNSELDLTKSVMDNDFLSSDEIKKLRDRAYRRFYFRPKMVFQALSEINGVKALLSVLNFIGWIKAPKK